MTRRLWSGPLGVIETNGHFSGTGAVHANTIEGFWSPVKRGMVGAMQKVSPKCLPNYVADFHSHYNSQEKLGIFSAALCAV